MRFRTCASLALLGVMLTGCGGGGGGGSDSNGDVATATTASPVVPTTIPVSTADTSCATDLQTTFDNLLSETNAVRAQYGVSPLKFSRKLGQAAQGHAEDMALRDYFAHTGPEGASTLSTRIDAVEYQFSAAGENLAAGYDLAQEVVLAWLDSPGHRENLLNSEYVDVGFGLFIDTVHSGDGDANFDNYWVQNFGRPTDSNTDVEAAYITNNCNLTPTTSADSSVLSNTLVVDGETVSDSDTAISALALVVAAEPDGVSTPEPTMIFGVLSAGLVLLRSRKNGRC